MIIEKALARAKAFQLRPLASVAFSAAVDSMIATHPSYFKVGPTPASFSFIFDFSYKLSSQGESNSER